MALLRYNIHHQSVTVIIAVMIGWFGHDLVEWLVWLSGWFG